MKKGKQLLVLTLFFIGAMGLSTLLTFFFLRLFLPVTWLQALGVNLVLFLANYARTYNFKASKP